jgi:RimJ/RimL family protein N-acetyltransferase
LYIVEDSKGDPFGVVRFDVEINCAEVHIYLVPDKQGQGYGVRVLDAAVEKLMLKLPICTLLSKVKPENVASGKVFNKAGFVEVEVGLYMKKL